MKNHEDILFHMGIYIWGDTFSIVPQIKFLKTFEWHKQNYKQYLNLYLNLVQLDLKKIYY